MKKNIEDAQVTILLEIDGKIHLVGMKKDNFDAVSLLIKSSAELAAPTGKTQGELNDFLGYKK